jgi:hypothetical protein
MAYFHGRFLNIRYRTPRSPMTPAMTAAVSPTEGSIEAAEALAVELLQLPGVQGVGLFGGVARTEVSPHDTDVACIVSDELFEAYCAGLKELRGGAIFSLMPQRREVATRLLGLDWTHLARFSRESKLDIWLLPGNWQERVDWVREALGENQHFIDELAYDYRPFSDGHFQPARREEPTLRYLIQLALRLYNRAQGQAIVTHDGSHFTMSGIYRTFGAVRDAFVVDVDGDWWIHLAEIRTIDGPDMTVRLYGPPNGLFKLGIRGTSTKVGAFLRLTDRAELRNDQVPVELLRHIQFLLDQI